MLPTVALLLVAALSGLVLRAVPPPLLFAHAEDYLPIHSMLELVAIAVSLMVFALGWALRHAADNGRAVLLGLAMLAVAVIDFTHTFSYQGMPELVTPSGPEKAINLWLAGRLICALALMAVGLLPERHWPEDRSRRALILTLVVVVPVIAIGLTQPSWLPRTFVAGSGLTPFKIGIEYLLAALYVGASTIMVARHRRTSEVNLLRLAVASWILALAEVLLTLYGDVTDLFNLLGHVAKAGAYLLIYQALFAAGVRAPYAALARDRALLRSLIDSIPDLIFFKNLDSAYIGFNKAFAAYCGKDEAAMIGKTDAEFAPPEIAAFYRHRDRLVLEAGQPARNEEWIDYPDGRHVLLETLKTPYRGPDGTVLGLIGVSRDITTRKQAEEALRRAHHELEMVTYVASHDLQEPVRTVASFLQLLQKRYGGQLGEDADQYIKFAVDGVHRMSEQLTGLLEFSRIGRQSEPLQPTDMNVVLTEVAGDLQDLFNASAGRLTQDRLPTVRADTAQMRSLLRNLIGNAIKYRHPGRPPEIHVTASEDCGEWRFCVSDNGIGIEAEYLDKIFVIFQRLHTLDAYDGTGIGLSICKKIVERHGGRIWAESRPGEGSTFIFTLPLRR